MAKLNRIQPQTPTRAMQTFSIKAPLSTHWRKATCEEVSCPMGEKGWKMKIDLNTELGQRQAHYIKYESGRKYKSMEVAPKVFELTFASGQECFKEHKVRMERPEIHLVRGGDWRGNPTGMRRVHTKPEFWQEEFAENQDRIKTAQERG